MDLADIDAVVGRWRPLSDDESLVAQLLLSDASAVIRAQYPGIDSQITSGQVAATVVAQVVAGMVKRAMLLGDNEGVRSESETVGAYSTTRAYANASGALYLTDVDDLLIRGYKPAAVSVSYG